MLQNFCFKFKLMENCDFFVVGVVDCAECVVVVVVVSPLSLLLSLAMLGDEEIFLMLHEFFAVVFEFGNFELLFALELL